MNFRLGFAVLAVVAASVSALGCTGSGGGGGEGGGNPTNTSTSTSTDTNTNTNTFSCGVGPASGPNTPDGTVTFDPAVVGTSEDLTLPFQDSNPDVSETLEGAAFSGPDAADFELIATFPISIAAGGQVSLQIRFTPSHSGISTATLLLDTAAMGTSPVQLQGTATAGGT